MRRTGRLVALLYSFAAGIAASGPGTAASFDFVPAPQTDLNRIYRIDRVTGAIASCQYGLQEGTSAPPCALGRGRAPDRRRRANTARGLPARARRRRVPRQLRTGDMSVCYVYEEKVVCTRKRAPR
jgi:hypothetical protein